MVPNNPISSKYAPGGSTLEMGELAKSGYATFVLVIGGFVAYELELWTIYKINK
jgi:hypothetical protein